MNKLFLLIFVIFSFSLFSENMMTPEERYEQAIFILRQNCATQKGDDDDHYWKYHIFRREGNENYNTRHDTGLTKRVAQVMNTHLKTHIRLNDDTLDYFDHGGTCSAMALDFLARYIHDCQEIDDGETCLEKVKSFTRYYLSNNTTFTSRQAAYNAIELKPEYESQINANDETFKHEKMQSLAHYHNITLIPATNTITRYEMANDKQSFKQMIDDLPDAVYLVRALSPTDWSPKKEYYGHSMVLIKGKNHSIYYDNSDGAVDITNRVSDYVLEKLEGWWLPEYRLYTALCIDGEITNLSEEICDCY